MAGTDFAVLQDGRTALMVASDKGHGELVKMLLDAGANVAAVSDGWTALTAAVYFGQPGATEALLAANADPNVQASDGTAPILVAAQQGFIGIVSNLLDAGANASMATRLCLSSAERNQVIRSSLASTASPHGSK